MKVEEIEELIKEVEEELKKSEQENAFPVKIIALKKQISHLYSALSSQKLSDKEMEEIRRMEIWAEKYNEERKKIIAIIDKYNLEHLRENILNRISGVFKVEVDRYAPKSSFLENYEIIQAVAFLKSCAGNEIEMKSTVSKPMKGEVKGQGKKVTLASSQLLDYFELWLTTMLEQNQDGLYQYEFGWDWKDRLLTLDHYGNVVEEHSFYYDSYTIKEVETILNYEKRQQKNKRVLSNNQRLGRIVFAFYSFPPFSEFEKLPPTVQYAFLYDLLGIKGLVPQMEEEATNTEKYDKVKGWVKAYEGKNPKRN